MRKAEREVIDPAQKWDILLRCPYMVLAMQGEGAPYQVPLNFGAEMQNGKLYLYFHCANEGTKLSLLRSNAAVSFCAANMLRVFNKGTAPCAIRRITKAYAGRAGRKFWKAKPGCTGCRF